MKLLTKELLRKLPKLDAAADASDPMVICKFFNPDSDWAWYAIEFDGKDIFFGVIDVEIQGKIKIDYFSLKKLVTYKRRYGLEVCRDDCFQPCRLSELRKELGF